MAMAKATRGHGRPSNQALYVGHTCSHARTVPADPASISISDCAAPSGTYPPRSMPFVDTSDFSAGVVRLPSHAVWRTGLRGVVMDSAFSTRNRDNDW